MIKNIEHHRNINLLEQKKGKEQTIKLKYESIKKPLSESYSTSKIISDKVKRIVKR